MAHPPDRMLFQKKKTGISGSVVTMLRVVKIDWMSSNYINFENVTLIY